MKTWFITGLSSGIGWKIVRVVLEKGDNAFLELDCLIIQRNPAMQEAYQMGKSIC